MKGLLSLTLAASLLGGVSAYAQSDSVQGGDPMTNPGVAKIAGKKFIAADGTALTVLAFPGGLAREIDYPGGAVRVKVFALQGANSGSVADESENSGAAGSFQLTDTGITTDYNDGSSEVLVANNAGGVSLVANAPSGESVCTAWYPEGHRFSAQERQAELIRVSDSFSPGPTHVEHGCGKPQGIVREAEAMPRHLGRHTAANSGIQQVAMTSPRLRGAISVNLVVAGK